MTEIEKEKLLAWLKSSEELKSNLKGEVPVIDLSAAREKVLNRINKKVLNGKTSSNNGEAEKH